MGVCACTAAKTSWRRYGTKLRHCHRVHTSKKLFPWTTTLAPNCRQSSSFMSGVMCGMTTVTATPRSRPWWAIASAWLPALADITPPAFSASMRTTANERVPKTVITWACSLVNAGNSLPRERYQFQLCDNNNNSSVELIPILSILHYYYY